MSNRLIRRKIDMHLTRERSDAKSSGDCIKPSEPPRESSTNYTVQLSEQLLPGETTTYRNHNFAIISPEREQECESLSDVACGRSMVTASSTSPRGNLSPAELIETACAMEVMSPKPGNVAPGQEFADATIDDFLKSARAIAPVLATAGERTLGETILQAVQATRQVVNHNTNLGIILLLSPLLRVPRDRSLSEGILEVLDATTVADSRMVYEAIRMAQPAGLGEAGEQDLNGEPTLNLLECMRLAADRDMIAAQYVNGFQQVLTCGQDWLREAAASNVSQPQQISWLAVRLLAEFGDSLIARKCGRQMSDVVREEAQELLDSGWPIQPEAAPRFADFDAFLREDGNRRNPGTTADLIAAILFTALRDGLIIPVGDWFKRKLDC